MFADDGNMTGVDVQRDRLLQNIRSLHQDIAYAIATRGGMYWPKAARSLRRLEQLISQPLRLNIFGEANAGKSSLVNYLLRQKIIPAGGFAGRGACLHICHADETALYSVTADGTRNRLTSKALARISEPEISMQPSVSTVIYNSHDVGEDMPVRPSTVMPPSADGIPNDKGTNGARILELGVPHDFLRRVEIVEARTFPNVRSSRALAQVLRPADMTIWCTLATQAWKETERTIWSNIPPAQRKNAYLFVTYRDAIRNRKDEAKILARLKNDDEHTFADVLMVSVRDAQEAKAARESEENEAMSDRLYKRSNVEAIEATIITAVTSAQQQKMRKSARVLRRIASVVRKAGEGSRMGPDQDIARKLECMAGETLLVVERAETK
jgi:putative component of toxin-antitoxin plasmid stabilization module